MVMHNDAVIRKVAAKKFASQKSRNIIACTAIALTTFMIYTIFSIGSSYRESMEMQQMQANGTNADAVLENPNEDQIDALKGSGMCEDVGWCVQAGALSRSQMETIGFGMVLRYADDVYWGEQTVPILSSVQGRYPKERNEILMPEWAAKKLGAAKVGEKTSLTYYYGYGGKWGHQSDDQTAEFVVSGIYKDNSRHVLEGQAECYISKSFFEAAPSGRDKYKTAVYISLKDGVDIGELYEWIQLEEEQELTVIPVSSRDAFGVLETGIIVLIIIVCGGLIIYNVLYISAAQDIQFLGQLKTLGMTKRQLKKYLRCQIRWLCFLGIPAGLLAALLAALVIVPKVVISMAVNSTELTVSASFSPLLAAGAVLLSVLAVLAGSLKPLGVAGNVSAITAVRYTNVDTVKKNRRERKKQNDSLLSLAWRNVFRSRKNALVGFLSLFLAITAFFTIDGLFSGISPSALVADSINYDFIISRGEIAPQLIEQAGQIEGVSQIEIQRQMCAREDVDEDEAGEWLEVKEGGKDASLVEEQYQQALEQALAVIPDIDTAQLRQGSRYATQIVGIGEWEFRQMDEKYGLGIRYDEFKEGRAGIWACHGEEDEIAQRKQPSGSPVTIFDSLNGNSFSIDKMAQVLVSTSEFRGLGTQMVPDIILSSEALQRFSDTYIAQAGIQMESPSMESRVHEQLNQIFGEVPGLTVDSRQEKVDELAESFSTMLTLGSALSLILFAIGIMNFINTVYAGILARKKELAMMECIGMSKKQVKKMLAAEGLFYMAVTCMLVLTAGSAVYAAAYQAFSKMVGFVELVYPLRAAGITGGVMLVMAVAVPLISYWGISEKSAVEQLRKVE